MPRTRWSISEPIPYEDELDLVDKPVLIQHVIRLETALGTFEAGAEAMEAELQRLEATLGAAEAKLAECEVEMAKLRAAPSPGQSEALRQKDQHIKALEQRVKDRDDTIVHLRKGRDEDQLRIAELTEANRSLVAGPSVPIAEEERLQIAATLRILTAPGFPNQPNYLTAAHRQAFAATLRRLLDLGADDEGDTP